MSYVKLWPYLLRLWAREPGEEGQTLFEFTLVVSLVAFLCVVILSALGVAVVDLFDPLAATMGFG